MYKRNSTGPRTEPWGTPLVTLTQSETVSPRTTLCLLLERNDSTQDKKSVLSPYPLSLCNNLRCGTMSKALRKSRYMTLTASPSANDFVTTSSVSSKLEVHDFALTKPCCAPDTKFSSSRYLVSRSHTRRSITLQTTDVKETGR